jgi:hypothetical protein
MIGKPCAGKPPARFDEGELEIEPWATTPALYSTEIQSAVEHCFDVEYKSEPCR